MLNKWQLKGLVRVAKTLFGMVDLRRDREDAFRVASEGIVSFRNLFKGRNLKYSCLLVMPMFRHHSAWQLQDFSCLVGLFRGRRNTFEAANQRLAKRTELFTLSVWSTCCC